MESNLPGEISVTSDMQMIPPLMAENKEELRSLLKKVKGESEKVGLKLNIQKTKIMASGLITSREIDGETVATLPDFIFLGSKITADGDSSHEIKRRLPGLRRGGLDAVTQHHTQRCGRSGWCWAWHW